MSGFDAKFAAASMTLAAMDDMEPHMGMPVVAAMAGVIAISECRIALDLLPHTTAAAMTTKPATAGHPMGDALAAYVYAQVEARFTGQNGTSLVDALGLGEAAALTVAMVTAGADPESAEEVFNRVAAALKTLNERVGVAVGEHVAAVIKRDLDLPGMRMHAVSSEMRWALCIDRQGDPARPEAMRRRLQALAAYGAVSSRLLGAEATRAVDAGEPLAPILAASLGITPAQLRTINGMQGLERTMGAYQDRVEIVGKLVEYDVPTHRWPTELLVDGWRHHRSDLEPRHTDTSAKRDALDAFRRDIVQPLIQARADAMGLETTPALGRFVSSIEAEDKKAWRKAVDAALVAGREPKPYGEAVEKWHRRVASINALRQEHTLPQPGWPALCKPWTSEDGRATITALTTAEELVDEGTTMQHCVGGYYDNCRSGGTQILSLAIDGKRHATLEILVRPRERGITISRGQFEGLRRAEPSAEAHAYVDQFVDDLHSGDHKTGSKALLAFIQERRDAGYEYDRRTVMGMDFVRRVWPLYQPLMRRDAGDDHEAWAARTTLVDVIDEELRRIHREGSAPMKKAA